MSRRVLLHDPLQAMVECEEEAPLETLGYVLRTLSEPVELARRRAPAGCLEDLLCADIPQAVRLLVLALPDVYLPVQDAFDRQAKIFHWASEVRHGEASAPPPATGYTEAVAAIGHWWARLNCDVERWLLLARQDAQMWDLAAEAMRQGLAEYDPAGNVVGMRGAGAFGTAP